MPPSAAREDTIGIDGHTPLRVRRGVVTALAIMVLGAVVLAFAFVGRGTTPLVLVLSPHPDDEMQAWGLLDEVVADQPVVLAFLTRGEATGQCEPDLPGWQEGTGELAPDPRPQGRGTASCEQARIASTVAFLESMAATTSWLPEAYDDVGTVGPLPDPEDLTERCDDDCRDGPGDVRVFRGGATTLLFFDLGDGDLTPGEVAWAARAIAAPEFDVHLPVDRRVSDLVGASFANPEAVDGGAPACAAYPHPDHAAVTAVLEDVDLGVGERQVYPTCRTDAATRIVAPVDGQTWSAAFALHGDQRVGHHPVHYGWLLTPYFPGDDHVCPADTTDCDDVQQQLFHRYQTFGVRP